MHPITQIHNIRDRKVAAVCRINRADPGQNNTHRPLVSTFLHQIKELLH